MSSDIKSNELVFGLVSLMHIYAYNADNASYTIHAKDSIQINCISYV